MSRFAIEKAVRRGNKARVALAAPAGGGKTYTALVLAKELAGDGDVIVIDTERGSASLYADAFDFQTIRWEPPYDPRELASLIGELGGQFAVVVVDSLSHFWMGEGGTLDIVDAGAAKARGNSYAGWKDGTPAQNEMVDAMLNSAAHVIVTMRSKTEYVLEQRNGKSVPVKVGMAPVQRDGIEYEFTVTCDLDIEHRLMVGKTRCSVLAGKVYKPGHAGEMGKTLREWLDGAEAAAVVPPTTASEPGAGQGEAELRAAPPAPPATDDDRQRLGDRLTDLEERDLEEVGKQWKAAGLPPRGHPDLNKVHVAVAAEIIEGVEHAAFDRRRKHVKAKMTEAGIKTDAQSHELVKFCTDGRTESTKALNKGEVDIIIAYLERLAADEARAS